jgi:hypothetical protein
VLTPAPITIGQYVGADFTGWRILAQTPGDERATHAILPWAPGGLLAGFPCGM